MSNFITDSVVMYRKLQKVYEETVFKSLEVPADELKSIITKLLEEKCEEYKLNKTNSVYDTKYYSVKSRVKASVSFYEKLIRKELGVKLTTTLDLLNKEGDVIKEKKGEIISALQRLDDIIGLRIVTELKADCENVLKLLLNSADFFLANNIEFEDLNTQPQKMNNGLEIIRIKGVYQDVYGFELQIKSKINETWGDLDHTLFYKDYSISPIRDTVQITMNNVGNLLDRIEKLLFDLRESDGKYSDNATQIQVQKSLEDELGALLMAAYGVTYNIKELAYYLYHFRTKIGVGEKQLPELNFDYLNFECANPLNCQYTEIRKNSLILSTLEGVYINWLMLMGIEITQDNIDDIISTYISILIELIKRDFSPQTFDFESYLKVLILNKAISDIFLKPGLHSEAIQIFNRLIEILGDLIEDTNEAAKIAYLFTIHYFQGDFVAYIESIKEDIDLNSALITIKEQVTNSNNEIDMSINKIVIEILEIITQ
jgi:ppGpp synthetase/RelA/SpoT-type nucleotidyltranferase